MTEPRPACIAIRSDVFSAEIDPLGAQLSSLRDAAGRDLLWNGDPAFWSGRAPLLFPIVGALNGGSYRIGAGSYQLPRHGFARGRTFSVEGADAAAAKFRLSADAGTRELYPFDFVLDVEYALAGDSLTITATIGNRGDEELLASFGHHPAFRWPLPYGAARDEHFVVFDRVEPEGVRRLDAGGLLRAERFATPVAGRRLPLTDALFEQDVLIFDRLHSRALTYGAAGGPRLRVGFPQSPLLGLWTKPGAPFICIEPWHGIADPVGYTGDFRDKPGIFAVGAGREFSTTMVFTLIAPA
jgi:galactose mutarotase-like enzyme